MDALSSTFEPAAALAKQIIDRFAAITALAGFALTILTFYPGFMTPDSFAQFDQGVAFHFDDWQPPIMAFVWSLLDAIRPGPEPMLFMQAGLYWGGVYYLLSTMRTRSTAVRWIVTALLFSPAVLNFAGVIWKDVQLAAVWAFVIGCTFGLRARGTQLRWPIKALLIAILAYGALVRQNSGLVAGPLLLYVLTGNPVARRIWITVAIYAAVAVGALASGQAVNRLLRAEHTRIAEALFAFDLAGVSVDSHSNAFPFSLTPTEMTAVDSCYGKAEQVNQFIWGNCAFIWSDIHSPAARQSVQGAWLQAVSHNIPAYLHHRTAHFEQFLDLTTPQASPYIFQRGIDNNNHGFTTRYHGFYHLLLKYVTMFSHTIIFRPATWLLMSVLVTISTFRISIPQHQKRFVWTASLSATAYLLTYLPFGVATDFRYAYLSIILTTFSLCVLAPKAVAWVRAGHAGLRSLRGLPTGPVMESEL
jgi:hypothetical protein